MKIRKRSLFFSLVLKRKWGEWRLGAKKQWLKRKKINKTILTKRVKTVTCEPESFERLFWHPRICRSYHFTKTLKLVSWERNLCMYWGNSCVVRGHSEEH